jgi:hypothetical protein
MNLLPIIHSPLRDWYLVEINVETAHEINFNPEGVIRLYLISTTVTITPKG